MELPPLWCARLTPAEQARCIELLRRIAEVQAQHQPKGSK
jgi:hypothetical protein